MSYSIEARPEDLVVIAILNKDFDVQRDLPVYVDDLRARLDALPQPIALITEVNDVTANFGDIVNSLGLLTQGKLAVLSHPNIRELCIVTRNDLYSLSAKALGQAQYGERRVTVTASIEEALDRVRQ